MRCASPFLCSRVVDRILFAKKNIFRHRVLLNTAAKHQTLRRDDAGRAWSMSTVTGDAPELGLNLFSDASLRAPYEDYKAIRDAGPAVRLRRPEVYAVGRFADVQAALRAPEQLISGEGVGFNDIFNAPRGMNVIQTDGALHDRLRA